MAALICSLPASSHAQAAKPPAECPASCARPPAAMDQVVRAVAAALAPVPSGTLVVTAPLESDEPAPQGPRLARDLAEQLAGRLGPGVRFRPSPLGLAAARSAAAQAPVLVWLRPRVQRGLLRLTGDRFPVPRTVWARARAPRPGPVAHGFGAAPLDAEVRSYLRPVSFAPPKVSKFQGVEGEVVALACGDLDADGGPDLVVVDRHRIATVRLRAQQMELVREVPWSDHVPVAPVPLRQPIGAATIVSAAQSPDGTPYLDVGLTDRSRSLRFSRDLKLSASADGVAVPVGATSGCATLQDLLLAPTLRRCFAHDPPLAFERLAAPSDALASTAVVGRDGRSHAWLAVRGERGLVVRSTDGSERVLRQLGAQLALSDLDQDGAPELLASLDVLDKSNDAIVVTTLGRDGNDQERFRLPVPTGVNAVAACPPDGPGRAAFVVASGPELWVVR